MKNNKIKFLLIFLMCNLVIMLFYVLYYKIKNPSILKINTEKNIDFKKQDMGDVISKYMQKLKKNPKDIETIKSLGSIFMQMRAWDKAVFFWEKAANIDSKDSETLKNLSTCYFFLKKYKQASDCLKKIIKIEPSNYIAKFNLAYLYGFALNNRHKAKEIFLNIISSKEAPENIKQKAKDFLKELNKGSHKEKK